MPRRSCDSGESLIETLVALVILGLAVVALLSGLGTAIAASALQSQYATAGVSVKAYAEAVKGAAYVPGAATASYQDPPGFTAPAGYTAAVQSVQCGPPLALVSACTAATDEGLQKILLAVSSQDGRATEKVVIVKRLPCRRLDWEANQPCTL